MKSQTNIAAGKVEAVPRATRFDGRAVPSPVAVQLLVFILVGAAGALGFVLLSTMLIGLRTGAPDWIVSAASYSAMIFPVYLAHRQLSFRTTAPHRSALPRYAAVQLAAVGLAALFSYVFHGVLAVPALPAAVLVVALTSGVNFLVLRAWAFAVR